MDTPPKVTRDELADLLERWERGELTAQQVWDWSSARYWPGETEIDDWENDLSATNEILAQLDSMDINLVVVDDVPIHRRFLTAPKERTAQAHEIWRSELNSIDYQHRMKTLRDNPIFRHVAR
jgi:hypothetical protein